MLNQSTNLLKLFAHADEVALVGNWAASEPVPALFHDDGNWFIEVPVEDNEYRHKLELMPQRGSAAGKHAVVADPKAFQLTLEALRG